MAYLRSESEAGTTAASPGRHGEETRSGAISNAGAERAPLADPSGSTSDHPLPPSAGTAALASAAAAKPAEMTRLTRFTAAAFGMTASGYVLRHAPSASQARELQSARADIARAARQKEMPAFWAPALRLKTKRLSERADREVRRAHAAVP